MEDQDSGTADGQAGEVDVEEVQDVGTCDLRRHQIDHDDAAPDHENEGAQHQPDQLPRRVAGMVQMTPSEAAAEEPGGPATKG
jgi:hypothetical protein